MKASSEPPAAPALPADLQTVRQHLIRHLALLVVRRHRLQIVANIESSPVTLPNFAEASSRRLNRRRKRGITH